MGGGPCDFSVSPSPFGLDFGTLDFGTSDLGLTIVFHTELHHSVRCQFISWIWANQADSRHYLKAISSPTRDLIQNPTDRHFIRGCQLVKGRMVKSTITESKPR